MRQIFHWCESTHHWDRTFASWYWCLLDPKHLASRCANDRNKSLAGTMPRTDAKLLGWMTKRAHSLAVHSPLSFRTEYRKGRHGGSFRRQSPKWVWSRQSSSLAHSHEWSSKSGKDNNSELEQTVMVELLNKFTSSDYVTSDCVTIEQMTRFVVFKQSVVISDIWVKSYNQ